MNKNLLSMVSAAVLFSLSLPYAGLVSADSEAVETKPAEKVEAEEKEPMSAIMDEPLNGESTESFNAGLAKVKAEATKNEYQKLRGAIGYLKTYDLTSRGDIAKLYSRLDGMSPRQILEEAYTRRGK